MEDFSANWAALRPGFRPARKMALATADGERVSARMMSLVQQGERPFEATPLYVKRWLYQAGIPFEESFGPARRQYQLREYQGQ